MQPKSFSNCVNLYLFATNLAKISYFTRNPSINLYLEFDCKQNKRLLTKV